MAPKIARAFGLAGLAFVVVWWGRLKAHSKMPPPEGHWREVKENELSDTE
jgi:hypothetical protein